MIARGGSFAVVAATSMIARVRRQQMIEAAVEVIDQIGVSQASLVRIARQMGVSRKLITYHFDSRAALFAAVVEQIYDLGRSEVQPEANAARSPEAMLTAFIRGSIAFYARHVREMRVLSALYASDDPDAPNRDESDHHREEMTAVDAILTGGQEAGLFRSFDVGLAADLVRVTLDLGLRRIIAGDPPAAVAEELDRFVLAGLRAEQSRI